MSSIGMGVVWEYIVSGKPAAGLCSISDQGYADRRVNNGKSIAYLAPHGDGSAARATFELSGDEGVST